MKPLLMLFAAGLLFAGTTPAVISSLCPRPTQQVHYPALILATTTIHRAVRKGKPSGQAEISWPFYH